MPPCRCITNMDAAKGMSHHRFQVRKSHGHGQTFRTDFKKPRITHERTDGAAEECALVLLIARHRPGVRRKQTRPPHRQTATCKHTSNRRHGCTIQHTDSVATQDSPRPSSVVHNRQGVRTISHTSRLRKVQEKNSALTSSIGWTLEDVRSMVLLHLIFRDLQPRAF